MHDLSGEMSKLSNFEGNWQMIPGTFNWEDSNSQGAIIGYDMSITETVNGLNINTKFDFKNVQQVNWRGVENISVVKDSPSGELIHHPSIHFSNNGWTNNSSGKTEITDQTIELTGVRIDNENMTYHYVITKPSANQITVSSTNSSGEKWSVDMKLVE